mgnify:CR=1 FL=1
MSYHHLALATKDMEAIHNFYENILGFLLVKVEIAPINEGGWAKHFFYRMNKQDTCFIAFWELHDVPGLENMETNLSKAAGLPDPINHFSFAVESLEELNARCQAWVDAGLDVLEIDHNWCRSIYCRDPNENVVEFCLTTAQITEKDRAFALKALSNNDIQFSAPPAEITHHEKKV